MNTHLGSQLLAARLKRGLTLLDAAHETRIPVQRLQWLEQDNYVAFGSLTYARAFLKIYSAYLDVDAGEILHLLPTTRLRGPHDYRHLNTSYGPWVVSDQKLARRLSDLRQLATRRSPVPAGIAIFMLMLIGTGIWGHHVSTRQLPPPGEALSDSAVSAPAVSVSAISENISAQLQRPVSHTPPAFDAGISATMQ